MNRNYTEFVYEWCTELTFQQREYLIYLHGSFEKALGLWIESKLRGEMNLGVLLKL